MAASFWQYFWWSTFAQHPEDRICYKTIQKHQCCSIMEMGLEDGIRGNRLIQVALRNAGIRPVHYYGIDLFEAHEDPEDRISLKEAHKEFTALGAKVKLIPGDPFSALARSANSIKGIDLVVIGHDQDPESVQRCWKFLPRCVSEDAIVLKQGTEEQDYQFEIIDRQKLDELAGVGKAASKKSSAKRAA